MTRDYRDRVIEALADSEAALRERLMFLEAMLFAALAKNSDVEALRRNRDHWRERYDLLSEHCRELIVTPAVPEETPA